MEVNAVSLYLEVKHTLRGEETDILMKITLPVR